MNITQLSLVRIMQRPSRCWNTALRLINNLIMSKKFPPASFLWFLGTDTKNFYPHINSDIQNNHVYSLPQSFNTHPPTFFSSDIITLTITPYIICGTDALKSQYFKHILCIVFSMYILFEWKWLEKYFELTFITFFLGGGVTELE